MNYLTSLGALPLLGGLLIATLPKSRVNTAKWIALLTSIAVALLGLFIAVRFEIDRPGFQFVEN